MENEFRIFTESSEDMGIMYDDYKKIGDKVEKFLNVISEAVEKLIKDPTKNDIDLNKDISEFKAEVTKKITPSAIELRSISSYKKNINKFKADLSSTLTRYSKIKKRVAFGGNYLRAILLKPKVYAKDIDSESYESINKHIRGIDRALDWVEKIIIDLFNMADQDMNILTIVDKVYGKGHIYESTFGDDGHECEINIHDVEKLEVSENEMKKVKTEFLNNSNTDSTKLKSQISESLSWIESFVYDSEFRESVNGPRFDNIKSPEGLLHWMDCIQYGWISSKDHSIQGTGDEDDEQEFYKYYRLQHPRDLVRSKIGVCWDQSELERYWFNNHNIKNAVLYFEIENGKECPTHTFLVFFDGDKVKWFEHSWGQYRGIHSYDNMLELIKDVSDKHRKSWNDFESPMKMTFLENPPSYNITCEEFMNYARSQQSAEVPSTDELGNIISSGDLMNYKISDDELEAVRNRENEYDPPISYDKLPAHLKNDPVHVWRAKNGIELIHKEPTAEELDRIWNNWQKMSNDQKRLSDQKSMELFGVNNEDNYHTLRKTYKNGVMESMDDDDLDWIEKLLMEDASEENNKETPPPMEEQPTQEKEPPAEKPEKESMPKKTDKAESSKNGVRRKNLYIAFIEWCKEYNNKNTFGSIFDKDAFNVSYPFVPEELRYFYRLANPMLCVLAGNLTFFAVAELRKLNIKNSRIQELLIFAATPNDTRVFNIKDKKVYRGTEENGAVKLNEVLGDTFDTYIQKMINKGDILNAPITEETEYVE